MKVTSARSYNHLETNNKMNNLTYHIQHWRLWYAHRYQAPIHDVSNPATNFHCLCISQIEARSVHAPHRMQHTLRQQLERRNSTFDTQLLRPLWSTKRNKLCPRFRLHWFPLGLGMVLLRQPSELNGADEESLRVLDIFLYIWHQNVCWGVYRVLLHWMLC